MNKNNSLWCNIALLLTIIGGLNWGLVGILEFDLVAFIFGEMTALTRAIYVVVALSSIISLRKLRTEEKKS